MVPNSPQATEYFEVTNYRYLGLTHLTHGIECEVEVWYRLSPDEPKDAHRRTFSSIAANIGLAEYNVRSQVERWEAERTEAAAREKARQERDRHQREEAELLAKMRQAVQS